MVRAYGRCRRGERLVCKTPWGHWKTTTFTCGLRCDGLVAPWVLEGPINGDAFRVYIEKVLVPTLSPGDTVIIDNLASHKVAGVREAIEAVGAKLLYLPPYSPDLNPIDLAFAIQDGSAKGCRTLRRRTLVQNRHHHRRLLASGMPKLSPARRIRFNLADGCFSPSGLAADGWHHRP